MPHLLRTVNSLRRKILTTLKLELGLGAGHKASIFYFICSIFQAYLLHKDLYDVIVACLPFPYFQGRTDNYCNSYKLFCQSSETITVRWLAVVLKYTFYSNTTTIYNRKMFYKVLIKRSKYILTGASTFLRPFSGQLLRSNEELES